MMHMIGYWTSFSDRYYRFATTMSDRAKDQFQFEKNGQLNSICFPRKFITQGKKSSYKLWQITSGQITNGKAPVVIVDPRAGRGPGVCATKEASQVGVALVAGHPVYLVTFEMMPVNGQTMPGVMCDIDRFVRLVHTRHANCPVPRLIGNCQAGWMLLIARNRYFRELKCPLQVNGSPLSYWSGDEILLARGLLAQLFGSRFMIEATEELGFTLFDGAHLSGNFEDLAASRVVTEKFIELWRNPSPEKVQHFLQNEKWWNQFYHFRPAEIRWILDNLFLGNRLEQGKLEVEGQLIDLATDAGPLVIFASKGDDITSPAQALGWIPAIFKRGGSTSYPLIFSLHPTCGHLGIFVSGSVAKGFHAPLLDLLDQGETLTPGIYQLKIELGQSAVPIPRTITQVAEICGSAPYRAGMAWLDTHGKSSPMLMPKTLPIPADLLHLGLRWFHPMRASRWGYFAPGLKFLTPWTGLSAELFAKHANGPLREMEEVGLITIQATTAMLQIWRDTTIALMASLISQTAPKPK